MKYSVLSIAKEILSYESMTQKKLQKLCYYVQANFLAQNKKSLIDTKFEAWVHGPVSYELYVNYSHYGWSMIPESSGSKMLPNSVKIFIESVLEDYISYSANALEEMTHDESPWINARIGLMPNEPSRIKISEETMRSYYKS